MKQEERDLRTALEPLAGDPVADAARVLRALPHPGVPPVAWWFLGVGLAMGAMLALWFADPGPGEPTPEQEQPTQLPEKEKPVEKPTDPWMDSIYFYGLGRVEVTEPGEEPRPLSGEYQVPFGTRFATDTALAGLLMQGEVMLRIDRASQVLVESAARVELTRGRVFVVSGEGPEPVAISTPGGIVEVAAGRAVVGFDGDRLQVVCLYGTAELNAPGHDPLVVRAKSLAFASVSGQVGGPSPVAFLPQHTGWMTRLIVLQQDPAEREALVRQMVGHYFGEEFRAEARAELRRLGSAAVVPLVEGLMERQGSLSKEFQRKTADFICNVLAGPDTVLNLFQLLHARDPEVRVIAYESLYRQTEDSYGTGDSFWRAEGAAAERERATVIRKWWEQVRDR